MKRVKKIERELPSKYVSLQHNFKLAVLIDTPILLNVSRLCYQTTFLLSIHRAPILFFSSRLILGYWFTTRIPVLYISGSHILVGTFSHLARGYESIFELNLGLQVSLLLENPRGNRYKREN